MTGDLSGEGTGYHSGAHEINTTMATIIRTNSSTIIYKTVNKKFMIEQQ
jgi:hypothetical protein